MHWAGHSWTIVSAPNSFLMNDSAAVASNDVWAVGWMISRSNARRSSLDNNEQTGAVVAHPYLACRRRIRIEFHTHAVHLPRLTVTITLGKVPRRLRRLGMTKHRSTQRLVWRDRCCPVHHALVQSNTSVVPPWRDALLCVRGEPFSSLPISVQNQCLFQPPRGASLRGRQSGSAPG